jgi:antitoxin component of RelBE/YafQ-DinJ toxin-antitoxin module
LWDLGVPAFMCRTNPASDIAALRELPFDTKEVEEKTLSPNQTLNPKQELPFDARKLEKRTLNSKQTLNPKQELPFDARKQEKRKKTAKSASEADDFGIKAMSLSSNSLFGGGTT